MTARTRKDIASELRRASAMLEFAETDAPNAVAAKILVVQLYRLTTDASDELRLESNV
jgi:hypothetical protein